MTRIEQKQGDIVEGQAAGRGRKASLRAATARRLDADRLEIRLPDCYVLRLVARSLLALIFVSFLMLNISPRSVYSTATAMAAATNGVLSRQVDDTFFLPTLFRDLKRRGLFHPGDRAMFLSHHAGSRLTRMVRQNRMELVTGCLGGGAARGCRGIIPDGTLDFVFSGNGFPDAELVDRALKAVPYRMASNYRIVYIRTLDSTLVAMKKLVDKSQPTAVPRWRRLLALPEARKEALNMLEDVLLEPPQHSLSGRKSLESYLKRLRFLPDLTGDDLHSYPRRIFIEVVTKSSTTGGSGGDRSAARWFSHHYPTRKLPFEILRLELEEETPSSEELSEWLRSNLREEEYVVMKAEAGAVEAMIRSGATSLVDELFLECDDGWGNTGRLRRPYWEYLSLYGKLRDAGVAVHQWWWS
ncbi:unnamed protein product [Spirodela intermedia]|uniref:DUF7870 domain-containing protein n=1 Tax=Spirodela intermedia TaxID=51605 RepID=A0A7I8INP1_SPIIN|nr:unnamed protein product [Spirodela intermedia]CAA6659488.1 unnamed protein product [Spirodela intermedia]